MLHMSSASYIKPEDVPVHVNNIPPMVWAGVPTFPKKNGKGFQPRAMNSVTASAKRITRKTLTRKGGMTNFGGKQRDFSWQNDAWDMYDLVGEERFLVDVLAGRMSQARLFVGRLPDNPTEDPQPVENELLTSLLEYIGDGLAGRSQLLRRLGINLLVPGEGWLIGVPSRFLYEESVKESVYDYDGEDLSPEDISSDTLEDLEWAVYSIDEVKFNGTDEVQITTEDQIEIRTKPDDLFMIRVWNSHPRKAWEATSPTRASLPVLRELVGLTMHISAQVDSRLAGAGMLIVPSSAAKALRAQMGLPEDSEEDPFTDALMDAMLTPIGDRANASAIVPLVITVPDESADKFQHITFDKPLDTEAKSLRDEAIRRLALGQDAPPELLLGMSSMNHWGAWLVREDVVTTHLEPPLALICDAITTQYLRPAMAALDYSDEEIAKHVIWYDVSDLVMRPNRGSDAERLYDKGVLSDETLRAATGFDESDAPDTAHLSAAQLMTLDMLREKPEFALGVGLGELTRQFEMLLQGTPSDEKLLAPTGEEEVAEADLMTEEAGEPKNVIPDTIDNDAPEAEAGL